MSEVVRVGQTWQDKDRRSPNLCKVLAVEPGRRVFIDRGKKVWVRLDRFVKRFRLLSRDTSIGAP